MSAPVDRRPERTVLRKVRASLEHDDGTVTALDVDLQYRSADPWAVQVTFWVGADPRDWVFARDLLRTGVMCASGEGDVTVAPHPFDAYTTLIELTVRGSGQPVEHAAFHFDVGDLTAFLLDTELLVRVGEEYSRVNWDTEYASLAGMWD